MLPVPERSSCRWPRWRSQRPAGTRASSPSARSYAVRPALRLRRGGMRLGPAARGDRDRRPGRLRSADGRQRRPGRGAHREGRGRRPFCARDGRPLRTAQGERQGQPAERAGTPHGRAATLPRCMSKVCAICGKKPAFGNHRSHSMVATKRRFDPNLQRVRVLLDGSPSARYVCTRCLKCGKSPKPSSTPEGPRRV